MAASPSNPKPPSRPAPDAEPPTPWQQFYRRYSAHGEMPRSSIASLAIHLLLVLILMLMSGALLQNDQTPSVATDVVRVGDDSSAAAGEGDGLEASGEDMEATEPADALADSDMPDTPSESVQTEVAADTPIENNTPTAEELLAETEKATKRTAAASTRAKAAIQRAKDKLKQNMSQGAGSGTGGGGGSGATGRAARPARWVIKFNVGTAQDYLAQYEGLGAKLAFPTSAGDKYKYFSNLTSGSPTSEVRDLSGEGRLYWMDDDPASAARVAQALGISPTDYFLAFLPLELEERMLKLELDAAGVGEDQIASTIFVVVPRGGNYEVQVLKQVLK